MIATTDVEGSTVDERDRHDLRTSDGDEGDGGGRGARRRRPGPRVVALVVAALLAASGVAAWWYVSGDERTARAEQRDTVLIQARHAIEVMNTLDHRDVDGGIAAWRDATTGTLRDQLATVEGEERRMLAEQKKISTGKVVDAAVVELEDDRASVVASVEVTVVDDAEKDAEPTLKRNRFAADLLLVEGEWLLEDLQQVAVGIG